VAKAADRVEIEVPEFRNPAEAARYLVQRVTKRAAQFGALADQLGDGLVYADGIGIERMRAAVAGESAWLNNLTKVLAVAAAAEQAAGRTDYSELRNQILEDVAFVLKTCLTTIAIRHHLDPAAFEKSFFDVFNKTVDWAMRGESGEYGKKAPAKPTGTRRAALPAPGD